MSSVIKWRASSLIHVDWPQLPGHYGGGYLINVRLGSHSEYHYTPSSTSVCTNIKKILNLKLYDNMLKYFRVLLKTWVCFLKMHPGLGEAHLDANQSQAGEWGGVLWGLGVGQQTCNRIILTLHYRTSTLKVEWFYKCIFIMGSIQWWIMVGLVSNLAETQSNG